VYAMEAGMVSSISVPESSRLQTDTLPPRQFGPFVDARQAVVPGAAACVQHRRGDPLSVVQRNPFSAAAHPGGSSWLCVLTDLLRVNLPGREFAINRPMEQRVPVK
jgi:hypothetical protein